MSHVAETTTQTESTMAKSKNPNPARATPKKRPVRLAVLIDTSNVGSPDVLDFVFQTIREREGSAELTCHAFGDFQKHTEWVSFCDKYSAKKHQHNEGKYGKNAADIAMVIMAMDIAYGFGRRTGRLVDGFCLVSSDTDFRALALRLHASNYHVIGFGRTDTPDRLKEVFSDGFYLLPAPIAQKESPALRLQKRTAPVGKNRSDQKSHTLSTKKANNPPSHKKQSQTPPKIQAQTPPRQSGLSIATVQRIQAEEAELSFALHEKASEYYRAKRDCIPKTIAALTDDIKTFFKGRVYADSDVRKIILFLRRIVVLRSNDRTSPKIIRNAKGTI